MHCDAGCRIRRRVILRRKKWISEEAWGLIRKRAEVKVRSERHNIDDQDAELARAVYKSLDSEVKRLTERDKRIFVD